MKKFFLYSLLLFPFFFSCKKEVGERVSNSNTPVAVSGRLWFKDDAQFDAFAKRIDSMSYSEINSLETGYDFVSLRHHIFSADTELYNNPTYKDLSNLPLSYQVLLNKDGEIQIGEFVIQYDRGNKYYFPAAMAARKTGKLDPSTAVKHLKYAIQIIDRNAGLSGEPLMATPFGMNNVDSRYKHEFTQVYPAAGKRRYIHELICFNEQACVPYPGYDCAEMIHKAKVFMRMRLEKQYLGFVWVASNNELFEVNWDLDYNIVLKITYEGGTVYDGATFQGNTAWSIPMERNFYGVCDIPLAQINFALELISGLKFPSWLIDLQGTMYQHVVGDVQTNEWNHVGQPFY